MLKFVALALFCVSMVSCQDSKESPEMKQLEEKKAEVQALEAELKELRAEIEGFKVEKLEVSVEELQKKLEEQKAAIVALKAELTTLTKTEKEAKEKLEAYQKKYPLQ